jgi:hypothetical protein
MGLTGAAAPQSPVLMRVQQQQLQQQQLQQQQQQQQQLCPPAHSCAAKHTLSMKKGEKLAVTCGAPAA